MLEVFLGFDFRGFSVEGGFWGSWGGGCRFGDFCGGSDLRLWCCVLGVHLCGSFRSLLFFELSEVYRIMVLRFA